MRTYALVGTGAALFMLVSTYGFSDVLQSKPDRAGSVSGRRTGAATVAYLIVSIGYPYITRRMLGTQMLLSPLLITYVDGAGVLRKLVAECSSCGFAISDLFVEREAEPGEEESRRTVTVRLALRGRGSIAQLTAELDALDGVLSVRAGDINVTVPVEA
jgi:putative Mg2+ transporter-C (MgtC) family protein